MSTLESTHAPAAESKARRVSRPRGGVRQSSLRILAAALASIFMALVVAVAPAQAARDAIQVGPAGRAVGSIVLRDGSYQVTFSAINSNIDVVASSARATVFDSRGLRTYTDIDAGREVKGTFRFPNRGPVTVQIIFTFDRVLGADESNAANPMVLNYP